MYAPKAFLEDDLSTLHGIMQSVPLANLVTATVEGIVSTPLPLLLMPQEGEQGTLYGHIARANAQWGLKPAGDALAIFMGPSAYISPSWYPSKQEGHKVVPTWNYIAVHVYGPVEFFDTEKDLLEVVTKLTNKQEDGRPQSWAVADAPEAYVSNMLKEIIGVRLPITRIDGVRKMSQNRTQPDRQGVVAGLLQSQHAADREVAECITL